LLLVTLAKIVSHRVPVLLGSIVIQSYFSESTPSVNHALNGTALISKMAGSRCAGQIGRELPIN